MLYSNYTIGGVLCHHQIEGAHWGERHGPPYPLDRSISTGKSLKSDRHKKYKSADALSSYMRKNFKYKNFTTLKDHEQMSKEKAGDCHSQVMYEMEELRKIGKNPKGKFFIQVDPKTGQGGQTHSFVWYKDGKDVVWFENAWGGNEGIHKYKSEKAMMKDIESMMKSDKYPEIVWGTFDDKEHKAGESLQELVDKCLR